MTGTCWLAVIALTLGEPSPAHGLFTTPMRIHTPSTMPASIYTPSNTPSRLHTPSTTLTILRTSFTTPTRLHTSSTTPTRLHTPSTTSLETSHPPSSNRSKTITKVPVYEDITSSAAIDTSGKSLHTIKTTNWETSSYKTLLLNGREDGLSSDHTLYSLGHALENIKARIISVSSSARDVRPSVSRADITPVVEDRAGLKFVDKDKNHTNIFNFDNKILNRTAANRILSVDVIKYSGNQTFYLPADEHVTESELKNHSCRGSEEVGSSVTPKSTTGPPHNTTLEVLAPRIPLCHLHTLDKNIFVPQILEVSPPPFTFDGCVEPEVIPFAGVFMVNNTCPPECLVKVAFNPTRKIVYEDETLYFSLDGAQIQNFCVEGVMEEKCNFRAVFCSTCPPVIVTDRCTQHSCMKKCCPGGHVLENNSCVYQEMALPLPVVFYKFWKLRNQASGGEDTERQVQIGFPHCGDTEAIPTQSTYTRYLNTSMLLVNGSLATESRILDYCIDEYLEVGGESLTTGMIVLLCPTQPPTQQTTWTVVRSVLIPAGLMVSCVFLAATLLCHLCVAALRDLHGLCLAAYVAALLVADATLFVTQAFSQFLSPSACVSVAVILHVAFLSTFFWLNVICYDVWRYVGLTVQAVPLYHSQDDFRRFFAYAVYAWGAPLVIGGVAVVIHSLPHHIDGLLKPDFVHNRCWFRDGKEMLAYFYGPMGVLCVVNTLLIAHTGLRLYCADKKCDCLFGRCRSTDHTLYRTHLAEFWQRFALFGVMVVCWVMEVVSWLVGPADSELWALTDTLNTFQGVFIFMTFLRSTKKRRLLQETLLQWSSSVVSSTCLTHPPLPQPLTPTKLLHRLRNCTVLSPFVKCCSERSHLTRQQVLDNIIFKNKMETTQSLDKKAFEDVNVEGDVKQCDCDVNKSFSPVWTLPHWKSRWSNTYFPNTGEKSSNEIQSQELVCENLTDSISLFSSNFEELSVPYASLERRPTFANWRILLHKTGSLSLPAGDDVPPVDGGSEVVCHGLTQKEH
nr:uncharacterized protein LOC123756856 [Procambarus clarkii]